MRLFSYFLTSDNLQLAKATLPSILAYCFCSILMTITNKVVLSTYNFNNLFFILGAQCTVSLIFLEGYRCLGLIEHRPFKMSEAKQWFSVSVLLVSMIYTGGQSLKFLSVPLYTIFKNITIVIIAYSEKFLMGGVVTTLMLTSFIAMILSSVIGGWADLSVSESPAGYINPGYFWMSANCISSAAFVLFMRKKIKLIQFKDYDTVFYNNLLSIPLMFILSFCLEDWSQFFQKMGEYGVAGPLWFAICFSGISAFAISYATSWCIRVTSSTTYSMVGSLNKLPIAIAGLVFFKDPVTFAGVGAIILAFASGMLYSYAKTQQRAMETSQAPFEPLEEVDIIDEEDEVVIAEEKPTTHRVDSRLWTSDNTSSCDPKSE